MSRTVFVEIPVAARGMLGARNPMIEIPISTITKLEDVDPESGLYQYGIRTLITVKGEKDRIEAKLTRAELRYRIAQNEISEGL